MLLPGFICAVAAFLDLPPYRREMLEFVQNYCVKIDAVGMLYPLRDKNKGTCRCGKGMMLVTTACPEGVIKVEIKNKAEQNRTKQNITKQI